MNPIERKVRAHIINGLHETGAAPSTAQISASLGIPQADVSASLRSLATQHRLVVRPGSDAIWMVHPFSGDRDRLRREREGSLMVRELRLGRAFDSRACR